MSLRFWRLAMLLLGPVSALAQDGGTAAPASEQVIKVTAKQFEYTPEVITVRVNLPVVLELTSLDRSHGFAVPELNLQGEIKPGAVTRIRFTPDRVGTFA